MANERKKNDKRKKDRDSPDFQTVQPEQKRFTMDMNGGSPQTNSSSTFSYPSFSQPPSQPGMSYGQSYGQPYYGSPPPLPMPMSQLVPPGSQNVLSGDVVSKLFERLDMMDKNLGQLQSIQSTLNNVTVQMNDIGTRLKTVETKVGDLERSREFDSKTLETIQGKQREIDETLKKVHQVEEEQKKRLIDLQGRQMRDNLIFHNIGGDEREETPEACYEKLVDVLQDHLKVDQARSLRFDRVHRLGKYDGTKTRPIIAKFCFYQERELVRKSAKNLKGTQYSVSQQYPKEIQARRKELVPTLKKLKDEGKKAYLSMDKLYVDDKLYRGELVKPVQQTGGNNGGRERGRGRGRGGFGQGRGRGQGHDRTQGNMRGGENGQGQGRGFADENRFNVFRDIAQGEGQGQMETEVGQNQGHDSNGQDQMGAEGGQG